MSPVFRRFLRGPLAAACIFTALFPTVTHWGVLWLAQFFFFLTAPALVVALNVDPIVGHFCQPLSGVVVSYRKAATLLVFFFAVLLWVAFLSLPYWSRFRIGKLSARGTEWAILAGAVVIEILAVCLNLVRTFGSRY